MKKLNLDRDKIISLHNSGLSDKEIAEQLGCERSNITYHLNKVGITDRKSKIDNLELRGRISDSLIGRYTGSNNPNYNGNSDERTIARGITKTIAKRKLRESDYTCQYCGGHDDLETHHIKPFNIIFNEFMNTSYSGNKQNLYYEITNYPDFMDESNMVVLCHNCHFATHYSDNPELNPYRWGSATTIEQPTLIEMVKYVA